jgi:hypothetical protein
MLAHFHGFFGGHRIFQTCFLVLNKNKGKPDFSLPDTLSSTKIYEYFLFLISVNLNVLIFDSHSVLFSNHAGLSQSKSVKATINAGLFSKYLCGHRRLIIPWNWEDLRNNAGDSPGKMGIWIIKKSTNFLTTSLVLLLNAAVSALEKFILSCQNFVLELHCSFTLWVIESIENCTVLGIAAGQIQTGEENESAKRIVE